MRFIRFDIENFKGIREARLDLSPAGAGVFTLIGLNESGKTTVLEAIDDFGVTREATEALYGGKKSAGVTAGKFIPKHLEASFTGKISVTALVQFETGEMEQVIASVLKETGVQIDPESLQNSFTIERAYHFVNSDFSYRSNVWDIQLRGKRPRNRVSKPLDSDEEVITEFKAQVTKLVPRIVYFPTFLFSIPEKILLNPAPGKETAVNVHYRRIIQDVASSLSSPLDIKTHLVDRILTEKTLTEQFLSLYSLGPDKEKQINATLNALSAHLTKTVFDSWGRIFSGNFAGRELLVRLGIDNQEGVKQVYLKIVLKDGQQEYEVSERSLGFRWFFSFLLFTYYRVYSKGRGATLFLLDEPASNLHSRAQTQLLDSFARIADGASGIMYSTHSHYMINPDWLDQAFVVANESIDYENEVGTTESRPTKVVVDRYRAFVGSNPDKTTYFQPVLDKLDVVPSRLDLLKPSVLVEGKGDFYVLEYGRRLLLKKCSDVVVVPTRGAAGMDELIGLFLGWGVPFAICLDADRAGQTARKCYVEEWALAATSVFTLADLDPRLSGLRIENLLDDSDRALISQRLGIDSSPSKSQIQLFFSEALARKEKIKLSDSYIKRIEAFEERLQNAFAVATSTKAKRA